MSISPAAEANLGLLGPPTPIPAGLAGMGGYDWEGKRGGHTSGTSVLCWGIMGRVWSGSQQPHLMRDHQRGSGHGAFLLPLPVHKVSGNFSVT